MATTTRRRPRSKRGQGEKLHSEILSAAQRLLLDTGDEEAVSIRAVADAVGVTPPSIYMHFADKEELLYAVCRKLFEELDELFEAEAAKSDDALESLRLKGHAYVRFGIEHPEHYRILFMRKRDPQAEAKHEADDMPAFDHLVDSVRRCMDAGAIPKADPLPGAIALWSVVHGLTSILISNKHMPGLDGNLDELIDYHLYVGIFGLENAAEKMAALS
jgi:AcrR family transcriptional regulator